MIKNLIIDLCGPLLTIDTNKINTRLNNLGVEGDDIYRKLYYNGRVKEFDKGTISADEFCSNVRSVLGCSLADNLILDAWNDLIVDFDLRNVEALKLLQSRCRLFLLSNSDVVNETHFRKYITEQAGFDIFGQLFDDVCFSNKVAIRKPDPAIFQLLAAKNHLSLSETMVVDDCRQHCESASTTGMSAFLCPGSLFVYVDNIVKML